MNRHLVQFLAVFVKEVHQTAQDKRIVFLLVVAPLIQLILLGYAIDFDVDHVPTVVVDLDHTPASRRAIEGMLADSTLTLADQVTSVDQGEEALEDGWADVVLIVPAGFSRSLARREPTRVQVLVNGTDPTRSGVAANTANGYLAAQAMQAAGPSLAGPGVDVRTRLLFNPTMSSPIYMVPGIAGMLLLMITTVITAMGLAREKEVGTLEQVRVTPLAPRILMLGKVTPFVLVGLLDVTGSLTIGAWLFDVPLRGSLLLFYVFTAAYLLNTVGMGLLVSTVSSSQQQAFIVAFMFMLPATLLSGTMTPIHAMPGWVQALTWVNPLRFYLEGVRGVLLKGATLADLWPQLLILAVYGSLILFTAASRFRKRLA